jgi:hypothetical protein
MKVVATWLLLIALLAGSGPAWEVRSVPVDRFHIDEFQTRWLSMPVACNLAYYFPLDCCDFVSVVEGAEQNETFGIHFNMTDGVPWLPPCDTAGCLSLDILELTFYDVLPAPNDQTLSLKVYGADPDGEPTGEIICNRDFAPAYTETAAFCTVEIDFTNCGQTEGADLSVCRGNFVALVTWKNSTGHPALVLDNVSDCVDSCDVYPRFTTHTYYYGYEGAWSRQDSVCDPGGCGEYGYLEAVWYAGFCVWSAGTRPTQWGSIKALYR